jgi:hypothetical protein
MHSQVAILSIAKAINIPFQLAEKILTQDELLKNRNQHRMLVDMLVEIWLKLGLNKTDESAAEWAS